MYWIEPGLKGDALLGEEGLGGQPDALVGHVLRRLVVDEVGVLDDLHAGIDGAAHRLGRIGMDRHIGAPVRRGIDGRLQFLRREGRHVERAVRRGDAAARGELDLAGALHELLAHALANRVRQIRDHRSADLLHARQRPGPVARKVADHAKVAVPGRHRDHRAGRPDARPLDDAAIDGLLEAEARAAHVAHRGEAAHEGGPRLGAGDEVGEADVAIDRLLGRRADEKGVPVRVDQPRHQRPALALDDACAGRRNGTGPDGCDGVAAHEDGGAPAQTVGRPVEHPHVPEQNLGRRLRDRGGRK